MKTRRILLCMGTRPEIIKMAPLYHALKNNKLRPLLLHTGQHHDMAAPMYHFFGITPDYSLHLTRKSDTLSHLSALLLEQLGLILSEVNPAIVLVHGDTSSAVMAALAAFYHKIPVGHVESGLRSHHPYDPFPEEKNREIIARLSLWHFAPTKQARLNLLRENIADAQIHVVGNTIVDAVQLSDNIFSQQPGLAEEISTGVLKKLPAQISQRRLMLVTAHRRENLGAPLLSITTAVRELLENDADLIVVWPVHSNPKIQAIIHAELGSLPKSISTRLYLTPPLSYPATLWLLKHAWLTLTDSGGIQEEAACFHSPVLVLRETTERPELIDSGGGILVGTERQTIVDQVQRLKENPHLHAMMRSAINPFGDGTAADQICHILSQPTQEQ